MLLFYRRIFSIDKQFIMFTRIMMFLIVASCITYVCGCIFQDTPVEAQWNIGMPKKSINVHVFYLTVGAVNMVLDFAIVGMVQHKVWQLHLDTRRKLGLSALLLLAAL